MSFDRLDGQFDEQMNDSAFDISASEIVIEDPEVVITETTILAGPDIPKDDIGANIGSEDDASSSRFNTMDFENIGSKLEEMATVNINDDFGDDTTDASSYSIKTEAETIETISDDTFGVNTSSISLSDSEDSENADAVDATAVTDDTESKDTDNEASSEEDEEDKELTPEDLIEHLRTAKEKAYAAIRENQDRISGLSERKNALIEEAEEIAGLIPEYEAKYQYDVQQLEVEYDGYLSEVNGYIANCVERGQNLYNDIQVTQEELDHTFSLNFAKKNELSAQLEDFNRALEKVRDQIEFYEKRRDHFVAELEGKKSVALDALDAFKGQYDAKLSEYEKTSSQLEEAIANKKTVIDAHLAASRAYDEAVAEAKSAREKESDTKDNSVINTTKDAIDNVSKANGANQSTLEDSEPKQEEKPKSSYLYVRSEPKSHFYTRETEPINTALERPLMSVTQSMALTENNQKPGKSDTLLDRILEKLAGYYPEHQVFALDSIDGHLRELVSKCAREEMFSSAEAFLNNYGYTLIGGEDVKKIRPVVQCPPGNEPAIIKSKVDSMLRRLEEYYPDHVIEGKLQVNHKKLSQSISGLYQWLGYRDAQEMLKAYGFEYRTLEAGRPSSVSASELVEELKKRYDGKDKPATLSELRNDNPDLVGNLKTINNKAKALFGMTLSQYLITAGVLAEKTKK